MPRGSWWVVVVALLLLAAVGVGLWWASGPQDPVALGEAPQEPVAVRPGGSPGPLPTRSPFPPPTSPDTDLARPAPPDTPAARVHATIAERLGLVAIHCPVPPELQDRTPAGSHAPRIQDGWYSDVVDRRWGERMVGGPVGDDGGRQPPLFTVTWDAPEGARVAPCTVLPLAPGTVLAEVVDEEGEPVPDVTVRGCDASAVTDDDGVARLEDVSAGLPCRLLLVPPSGIAEVCLGSATVVPEAWTDTPARLEMVCADPAADPMALAEMASGSFDAAREAEKEANRDYQGEKLDRASLEEELGVFRSLRQDPELTEAGPMIEALVRAREAERAYLDELEAFSDGDGPAPEYRSEILP